MANIACYLSSHGYGHAVRSAAVIDEMSRLCPEARIFIISAAPAFLFERLCSGRRNVLLRNLATDFGLVQKDPRFFSLTETAEKLGSLISDAGSMIEREREFLVRENIGAVWSDLPFLPCEAAFREGLPIVGMGNFSWDWVYEYYREVDPVFGLAADLAASCYRHCGLYLKLPCSPPAPAFVQQENIPLACRTPSMSREQAREMLGIPAGLRLVLVGFSGLSLGPTARKKLESMRDTIFLLPAPMDLALANGMQVPVGKPDFPSLVAASDVLVTKPGYGIITDAILCDTPIVYTERGDFPEVPWLEKLIRQSLGGTALGMQPFEDGDWAEALLSAVSARDALRASGLPRLQTDGTQRAASRFLEFCQI
jgi:L-arabinokinase